MIRPLAILLAMALWVPAAKAQDLLADVSEHLVAITTGFDGADVLVFGSLLEPADMVIVVRGPAKRTVVHRKGSLAGIWVNTATMSFPQAPSFYAYAASRPLEEIVAPSERRRLRLGLEDLNVRPASRASPNLLAEWRSGLVRAKERLGLYVEEPTPITILGGRLFRSRMELPTNVPTGTFLVDVYLFRDGLNIAAQTIPLVVSKVGLEAFLFQLAHEQGALYGLGSILLALFAGWIAFLLFRRR